METIVERPAALDVHKAQVTACVRVPVEGGGREQHVAEFATTVRGPAGACATGWRRIGCSRSRWRRPGCTGSRSGRSSRTSSTVCSSTRGMSSRSRAARPTSRTRPGCASCWRPGCCGASFVPPKPIRALRNLTRYRKTQIEERAAGGQPAAQGARGHRDQARLRRHATSSARPGGRCSTRSVDGTTDPEVLAELARGQAAREDPGAQGGARGPLRPASTRLDRRDPRPPRLPRRADRRGSPTRSRSSSPLSQQRLSCSARSRACNGAPPR